MAKIFLDTNIFVDLAEKRKQISLDDFLSHELYLSPLSIHILAYLYRYRIPNEKITDLLRKHINLIAFNKEIVQLSLQGPTLDFEDNVQLHSAAEGMCDFFLTTDRKLLALAFFGKTKLVSQMPQGLSS